MPHVHRQLGQLRLQVGTGAIPADQCFTREAVPHVMDPWPTALAVVHAGGVEQLVDASAETRTGIAAATAAAVTDKRCRRPQIERRDKALAQVSLQFGPGAGRQCLYRLRPSCRPSAAVQLRPQSERSSLKLTGDQWAA